MNKQQRYNDKRFEALYDMMMNLQTSLAWARTAEERQRIHERINEVLAAMNGKKSKK